MQYGTNLVRFLRNFGCFRGSLWLMCTTVVSVLTSFNNSLDFARTWGFLLLYNKLQTKNPDNLFWLTRFLITDLKSRAFFGKFNRVHSEIWKIIIIVNNILNWFFIFTLTDWLDFHNYWSRNKYIDYSLNMKRQSGTKVTFQFSANQYYKASLATTKSIRMCWKLFLFLYASQLSFEQNSRLQ